MKNWLLDGSDEPEKTIPKSLRVGLLPGVRRLSDVRLSVGASKFVYVPAVISVRVPASDEVPEPLVSKNVPLPRSVPKSVPDPETEFPPCVPL